MTTTQPTCFVSLRPTCSLPPANTFWVNKFWTDFNIHTQKIQNRVVFFHDIKYLRNKKMKNWLIIRTFKQLTVDCHILKEYDSISGLKDVNVRIFINIIYAFRWLVLCFFSSSLAQQPISPHSIGYFRDRNGVGWNRCCVRKWESAKLNDNQHDFVCVFFFSHWNFQLATT